MKNLNRLAVAAFAGVVASPVFVRAAEEGAAAGSTSAGLPPTINEGLVTAIITLIVFIVLLGVLSKVAWGPIAKGLADREEKIRRDIQEAEAARARAELSL